MSIFKSVSYELISYSIYGIYTIWYICYMFIILVGINCLWLWLLMRLYLSILNGGIIFCVLFILSITNDNYIWIILLSIWSIVLFNV